MNKKDLRVAFNAKLNDVDTEIQTLGCRANNPDICANNGIDAICAFNSDEGICRKPSRAWKKQYTKLKGEESNE